MFGIAMILLMHLKHKVCLLRIVYFSILRHECVILLENRNFTLYLQLNTFIRITTSAFGGKVLFGEE